MMIRIRMLLRMIIALRMMLRIRMLLRRIIAMRMPMRMMMSHCLKVKPMFMRKSTAMRMPMVRSVAELAMQTDRNREWKLGRGGEGGVKQTNF